MTQNILFTCAGRRNYLINYFKEALMGNGKIIAADQSPTAPAMVDADLSILVPNIYSDEYIDCLIQIIKTHKITAIIPLNDLELPILAKNKERLENESAKVIISTELAVDITFDKWKTFKFIEQIGLKSPKTYMSLDAALEAIKNKDLNFPLVVKPRWGSASIGIDFPDTPEELLLSYKLQTIKLHKSVLKTASRSAIDNAILIQEQLDGIEYGLDILNDFEGNYIGTFARQKLSMRSGETDKAVSVIDPKLEKMGAIIAKELKHIGNLDCDVFKCNDEYYILELNPRFGGGYPFSHEANINIPAIYIDWLNGIDNISKHNRYQSGILFSKCDRLIDVSSKK